MPSLKFEITGNIGWITLNRPDKLNSFNREMSLELLDALKKCESDEVRCVFITGEGKGFSAGQDLAEVTAENGPSIHSILLELFNPIVTRIREIEKPVIAAVNGVAAGAGANIALCCDIVVASQSASFIQAFSKIGLIPDSGGTHTLPRLIGWQKASALMMLGEKVSATDAEKMGMIYRVFPAENFMESARELAVQLAKMPTRGLAFTKKALKASFTNSFEQQLSYEDEYQQKAAATEDYREGVAAFIEKREARFTGK